MSNRRDKENTNYDELKVRIFDSLNETNFGIKNDLEKVFNKLERYEKALIEIARYRPVNDGDFLNQLYNVKEIAIQEIDKEE